MTRAEREQLQSAVRLLMSPDDGAFDDAMEILGRLSGLRRCVYELKLKHVSPTYLWAATGNSEFHARTPAVSLSPSEISR